MRYSIKFTLRLALLSTMLIAAPAMAETASVYLDKGIYAEQTAGDMDAAAQAYQQAFSDPSAEPAVAAQAGLRLGQVHARQKKTDQAVAVYKQVIQRFPNHPEAARAQAALAAMTEPDPAALMPAGTIAYLEVGSPGAQIEKVVRMLKGTPLEGALQAQSRPAQANGRQQGPMQFLTALLNPDMIEEIKKVRGLAVGLQGMPSDSGPPPFVAALYPGESNTVRGMLMAMLTMAGQPGEPINGMQTLVISPDPSFTMHCAYDEHVLVLAYPQESFVAAVNRYKGLSDEPSLLDEGTSFARLTQRESRRSDALTLWIDPAVATNMAKAGGAELPEEFMIANAMLGLEGMDGAVLRLVLDEKNPFIEASLSMKEGSSSLAYDLIRTPRLTPGGFAAVPADAVALLSFAMNDSDGNTVSPAAGEAVKRFTGLDIGRELFSNIEQVNLFIAPPPQGDQAAPLSRDGFFMSIVGLSITSKDPAKTRQILHRLLMVPAMAQSGEALNPDVPADKYLVSRTGGIDRALHVAQAGKSTVLSFSRGIVDRALQAGGSVPAGAADLRQVVAALPPDAAKALLVDLGGLFALVDAAQPRRGEATEAGSMQKLSQAFSHAIAHLYTIETPDRLTLRLGVENLPPLAEAVPLIMQATGGARKNSRPARPGRVHNVQMTTQRFTSQSEGISFDLPPGAQTWGEAATMGEDFVRWVQLQNGQLMIFREMNRYGSLDEYVRTKIRDYRNANVTISSGPDEVSAANLGKGLSMAGDAGSQRRYHAYFARGNKVYAFVLKAPPQNMPAAQRELQALLDTFIAEAD